MEMVTTNYFISEKIWFIIHLEMDDHLTIRQKKLAVDGLRDYRPFLLLNFPLVVARRELGGKLNFAVIIIIIIIIIIIFAFSCYTFQRNPTNLPV